MSTPAVETSESMYRQVGPGGDPIYFDPSREPLVHHAIFLPTRNDGDGLSLIRSRFRSEIWSAFRKEKPSVRFRLARLQIQVLAQVAVECEITILSYLPTPDGLDSDHGEPWAHCVVTEINRTIYDSDQTAKRRIKEWALRVSDLITSAEILGPFDEPTANDPYRPDQS